MRDISLHLLDLMENSLKAGARHIDCGFTLDEAGKLTMTLRDDGCGMDEAMALRAADPFVTSRSTRKVGLGIPLTKLNAERTGGSFTLHSTAGQGTSLSATFDTRHLDCLPLGDLPATLMTLIASNPRTPEFRLSLKSPRGDSCFDTADIRKVLGDEVPLSEPEVLTYLKEMLQEQCQTVFEGEYA